MRLREDVRAMYVEATPKAAKRVAANATGGKLDVDEAQDAEIVERKNG